MVRITPRTGPMHGVQPKAKARPSRKAPTTRPPLIVGLEAGLALQEGDRQQTRHVQPEQQHHDAGRDAELVAPAEQERAECGGTGAERDEHHREAEHEAHSVAQRLEPRALAVAQLLERGPGHIGQIAGHQRQDAGREKGDHAGRERGGEADRAVLEHAGT